MSRNNKTVCARLLLGAAGIGLLFGCTAKTPTVSFKNDVQPILAANCVECHKEGADEDAANGLKMDSYAGVMQGTQFGRVVIPGDALTSALVMLIEGRADSSIAMPHNGEPIDPEQISLIRNWVEQGAKDN